MIEGRAEESELLIEARMPTQAQEIDGRVLINDLGSNEASVLASGGLSAGDLALVEITEQVQQDFIARLVRITKPAFREALAPGLTAQIQKGMERREDGTLRG
jgi:hypothetical protein